MATTTSNPPARPARSGAGIALGGVVAGCVTGAVGAPELGVMVAMAGVVPATIVRLLDLWVRAR